MKDIIKDANDLEKIKNTMDESEYRKKMGSLARTSCETIKKIEVNRDVKNS